MMDDQTNLSALIDEHERKIETAERDSYLVRGRELGAIRDDASWRARYNHATFEEYCEQRWELEKAHTYRLISAAAFAEKVSHGGLFVPTAERQIRPLLTRLEADEDRIAVWRDVLASTNGAKIKAADVESAISRFQAMRNKEFVTLDEWRELNEAEHTAVLSRIGKSKFNKQTNDEIEWADWSWNPVTGCLHACPYCYARDIAFDIYPQEVGFAPTIWPERLSAPVNQTLPKGADQNVALKNIFTCSMADLFGRWVPSEWIERVLQTAAENAQWNFLFLTKFPKRMSEFDIPANAWMGTTVDLQARVANAEKAFENVKSAIKWLSIEPMLEPLKFKRLDLFDWIVIGGASPSKAIDGTPATPAWTVPIDWIADLHRQARDAGCKIYYKTNSGLGGLTRIREYPGSEVQPVTLPEAFQYLGNLAKKDQIG
jgi:protein gp37